MLRMGRNPKTEPNENERQTPPQQQQAYGVPAPTGAAPNPYAHAEQTPVHYEAERPAPATPRPMTETETLAREIKDGTMSGFVGGGTVLSGEAVFKGMLRIDGHLTGSISSEKGTLIVSSGGRVDANIAVATAKINGIVVGDITASERLELGRTAQVHGNVQTPVLTIEQGAIFEGKCRMSAGKPAQESTRPDKTPAKQPVVNTSAPPKPAAATTTTTSPLASKSVAPAAPAAAEPSKVAS